MIPKHSSFLYVFFKLEQLNVDWSFKTDQIYTLMSIHFWLPCHIYMADNLEEESYGKISCIAKDVVLFVVTPLAVAENW